MRCGGSSRHRGRLPRWPSSWMRKTIARCRFTGATALSASPIRRTSCSFQWPRSSGSSVNALALIPRSVEGMARVGPLRDNSHLCHRGTEIAMKASQKSILAGLVILVAAAVAGLVLTRTSPDSEAPGEARRAPAAGREPVIDKRTLETAQKLAALAVTPEEQQLAHDAQRLPDHESD